MISESDARLEQIRKLASILQSEKADSREMPAIALTMTSLCEEERLHHMLADAYKYAARAFEKVGDIWNTVKFARLATEYGILRRGFQSEEVRQLRELARWPS
jgi:hypothetical protein